MWWKGWKHYERILLKYFEDLFTSSQLVDIEQICEVVKGKLNLDHRALCDENFYGWEVGDALFQMHPLKSSCLDGLLALFFQ